MTTIAPPAAARSYLVADSTTMLRRTLLRMIRYPGLTIFVIAGPVVFLLLFVFVLGGTLGAGLPGVDPDGGRAAYLEYVIPGILALTIAGMAGGAATTVAMDMREGFTARLRTMAISRAAVLTGHVLGNTIQAVLAVAIVLGVGIAVGFRPSASAADWLAVAGIVTVFSFGIAWIAVAMGMQAKSIETASNMPTMLMLLPFLGSGFVPTESLPGWMQGFAQYQPFTPLVETLRGLMLGTPLGTEAWLALGWSAVLALGGYAWARTQYERSSLR
jgi:ABC-2 type transport system permease protein